MHTLNNDDKVLVLCSGGLDSATLLAMAVEKLGAYNVVALSISYGQKHARELDAARAVTQHYGVELHTLDLAQIFADSKSSLLSSSEAEIPSESYAEQLSLSENNLVSTYVPFRNGLFLSTAASIALSLGCTVVAYGAHHDDWAGEAYPDCSPEFVDMMASAISEGTAGNLRMIAPFVNLSKADIVAKGLAHTVPFELTWSCYEGADDPCGKCATCIDRAAAFEAHGEIDPLLA